MEKQMINVEKFEKEFKELRLYLENRDLEILEKKLLCQSMLEFFNALVTIRMKKRGE